MRLSNRMLLWMTGCLLGLAPTAGAGQLSLGWNTVDGGGGLCSGGNFDLQGTIGQWDASPPLAGGDFTLTGGFWYPATETAGGLIGDLNCDGTVTVTDISGFVLLLSNPTGYAAQYPGCDPNNGDINGDGQVTVSDIGLFVSLLTGG